MRELPERLEGWDEISRTIGRSISWCKRRTSPNYHHPLPISHTGMDKGAKRAGWVVITRGQLLGWMYKEGLIDVVPGMEVMLPCPNCGPSAHRVSAAYQCIDCRTVTSSK